MSLLVVVCCCLSLFTKKNCHSPCGQGNPGDQVCQCGPGGPGSPGGQGGPGGPGGPGGQGCLGGPGDQVCHLHGLNNQIIEKT